MLEVLKSPEVTAFALMLAAVLTPMLFGYLKAKATKTKTKTDDEFLVAIEDIVTKKLAEKAKKSK